MIFLLENKNSSYEIQLSYDSGPHPPHRESSVLATNRKVREREHAGEREKEREREREGGGEREREMISSAMFSGVPHAVPRKALRRGISKSILQRPCQFLAINAHKMAPRTSKGLQERAWDAPTKGLLWNICREHSRSDISLGQPS